MYLDDSEYQSLRRFALDRSDASIAFALLNPDSREDGKLSANRFAAEMGMPISQLAKLIEVAKGIDPLRPHHVEPI